MGCGHPDHRSGSHGSGHLTFFRQLELADVLVPFFFFGLLACQTVRLVCYRETDALSPMVTAGFAILVGLVVLARRNGDF